MNSHAKHFNPEDGVSMSLRNVDVHILDYIVSHSRRHESEPCRLVHVYPEYGFTMLLRNVSVQTTECQENNMSVRHLKNVCSDSSPVHVLLLALLLLLNLDLALIMYHDMKTCEETEE
jgi:hypothetical protein